MNQKNSIGAQDLLTLRIITASMTAGPTFFLAFVLFQQTQNVDKTPPADASIIPILTGLSVLLAIVFNILTPFILKKTTASYRSQNMPPLRIIQSNLIIRLALAEGSALLGLVCMFLAAMQGFREMYIWVNLLPLAILYYTVLTNFPNKQVIENKMKHLD
ncbi:MAG: hypothetical protein AAF518_02595 [Spirochaetota bacterium]